MAFPSIKMTNHVVARKMSADKQFSSEDIKNKIESASEIAGANPQYLISDNAHNLVRGITDSGFLRHADISHSFGVIFKQVYGKHLEFLELTKKLGQIRLQYQLTDKAYLLPPNMRTIARFMNMSSWVTWGNLMLACLYGLSEEKQQAFSFLKQYEPLLRELQVCLDAVKHVEGICKNQGFSIATSKECKSYIVRHVLGNAYHRQVRVGLKMIEYFKRRESFD